MNRVQDELGWLESGDPIRADSCQVTIDGVGRANPNDDGPVR